MDNSRRIFMIQAITTTAAVLMPNFAFAASMLSESDRDAMALGYKTDSSRVDKEKYPRHESTQHCGNCSWYQGRSSDASASCALYARDKHVSVNGWCSSWMKKS